MQRGWFELQGHRLHSNRTWKTTTETKCTRVIGAHGWVPQPLQNMQSGNRNLNNNRCRTMKQNDYTTNAVSKVSAYKVHHMLPAVSISTKHFQKSLPKYLLQHFQVLCVTFANSAEWLKINCFILHGKKAIALADFKNILTGSGIKLNSGTSSTQPKFDI